MSAANKEISVPRGSLAGRVADTLPAEAVPATATAIFAATPVLDARVT